MSPLSDPATTLVSMPPTPPLSVTARSAAELNEAIRALWMGPGAHPTLRLTDVQREEYRRLLVALLEVERGDVATAA